MHGHDHITLAKPTSQSCFVLYFPSSRQAIQTLKQQLYYLFEIIIYFRLLKVVVFYLYYVYVRRSYIAATNISMDQNIFGPHFLTEEDIPGSSLSGRIPASLKNAELKFWLQCRGDKCKGLNTKAQYVKRYV